MNLLTIILLILLSPLIFFSIWVYIIIITASLSRINFYFIWVLIFKLILFFGIMYFSLGIYSAAYTLFLFRCFSSSNSKDLFSRMEIDYADEYEITHLSNVTEYYKLKDFTQLEIVRFLHWTIDPNVNYICKVEIITSPIIRDTWYISEAFIINSSSSVSLLEKFLYKNKNFLSALRKHSKTILLIHYKQIYEIKKL